MATLREVRLARQLTQSDVGTHLGVSYSRVAVWESGAEPVPLSHRPKLVMLLQGDIEFDLPRLPRLTMATVRRVRFRVRGVTGEKDDRQEWFVREVFTLLEPAQELALRLNTWLMRHHLYMGGDRIASWRDRDSAETPLDLQFTCDYTGTLYDVVSVIMPPVAKGGRVRDL